MRFRFMQGEIITITHFKMDITAGIALRIIPPLKVHPFQPFRFFLFLGLQAGGWKYLQEIKRAEFGSSGENNNFLRVLQ